MVQLKLLFIKIRAEIKKNPIVFASAFFSIFFNIESVYAVHVGDSYGGGTVFCVSDTADTSKCTTEKESSGDYGLIPPCYMKPL
jgi:hypothetical protein